jgi:hypothetical protein
VGLEYAGVIKGGEGPVDVLEPCSGMGLGRGELHGEDLGRIRIFNLVDGTHSTLGNVPKNSVSPDSEIAA